MSDFRLAAGVTALAIGAAVVTALAANPEVKSDPATAAAAANSEANADPAAPAAAKSDRLFVRPPLKSLRPVRKSRGRTAANGGHLPRARFTALRGRADRSQKKRHWAAKSPSNLPTKAASHACDQDRGERDCLRRRAVGGLRNGRPVRYLRAEESPATEHGASGAGARARRQGIGPRGRRYAVYRPSDRRCGFAAAPPGRARI